QCSLLAAEALAADSGSDSADSETEVRFVGTTRFREDTFVQSVAHDCGASAAGQPEPRAVQDVQDAFNAAAIDEQRAALRAERERDVSGFVICGLRRISPHSSPMETR